VIRRGSTPAPDAIAPNAPMSAAAISRGPQISASTPGSAAARSASAAGVIALAGALPRSRARLAAAAPTAAASTADETSWCAETISAPGPAPFSFASDLNAV
jgi:hypothetical protein